MNVDAEIEWAWVRLEDLSVKEWHHVISLRQAVFVVEQDCPYLDADALDLCSWHLIGWSGSGDLVSDSRGDLGRAAVAYLRVVDADAKYEECSIGRLLIRSSHRGVGLGHRLMKEVMRLITEAYPGQPIRISAQEHLQGFYHGYGFVQVGDVYDEDGIPHIEMLASQSLSGH